MEFSEFPEDVQIAILSFLCPAENAIFSCTSKRYLKLCSSDVKVWLSMCERRWGEKTQIRKWGKGCISFKLLYSYLEKWDNLVGFWRRIGQGIGDLSPLVFFEWGEYFIVASRVFPYRIGSYEVMKVPFLWMGLSDEGHHVNTAKFLSSNNSSSSMMIDGDGDISSTQGEAEDWVPFFDPSTELRKGNENVRYSLVNVNFMGRNHIVIEQNYGFSNRKNRLSAVSKSVSPSSSRSDVYGADSSGEDVGPESPPDHLKLEMYQHFANRTSPVRRQRKKEKVKASMKKWETEDYVKIVHSSPTFSRPLQGLWKGISDNMNLDFYFVSYDDMGGLICRKVGESSEPLSGSTPIFWTSNSRFMDPPFSTEEDDLHSNRVRGHSHFLTRLLYINSCHDLVDDSSIDSSAMTDKVEGRVWQYNDGCFSFGFLRNNSIVDLKPVDFDNLLLDVVELH